jgi:hypothetical protein
MLVFPLHLLYLIGTSKYNIRSLLDGLRISLVMQLSPTTPNIGPFPSKQFVYLMIFMLIGVTLPGLLWFAAVPLAPWVILIEE